MYLPNNCCTRCPLLLFVSMVVHDTSPKPFSFQPLAAATRFLQPFTAVARVFLQMTTFNVETPSSFRTFHHAVPSPSFPSWQLSLTENPSSKCDPLSLPTRVLGVILRKEALKPCRNSLFTFFITDSTVSILSLNSLIFEPPGYKRGTIHSTLRHSFVLRIAAFSPTSI